MDDLTMGQLWQDVYGSPMPLDAEVTVRWHIHVTFANGSGQWVTVLRKMGPFQQFGQEEESLRLQLRAGRVQFATQSRYKIASVDEIGTVGFELA